MDAMVVFNANDFLNLISKHRRGSNNLVQRCAAWNTSLAKISNGANRSRNTLQLHKQRKLSQATTQATDPRLKGKNFPTLGVSYNQVFDLTP